MPVLAETTLVRRHESRTGDWVEVRTDGRRIAVEAGGTGNRLDPHRRVRRSGWEIRCIGDDLELLSTWPVPELVTHRAGEHVAQLRDDVAALRHPPRTDLALRHPPAMQAVDGLEIGRRRVVLPRTADELVEWGAALDNCLGGFRHAVADGRTHVLGVVVGGRLRWAVEITRAGVVHQFEGAGNRRAPEQVVQPVLAALRSHGVVRADGRRGCSLLAPR